jgi:NADH-ubiquinone oxidoreductase chain 2
MIFISILTLIVAKALPVLNTNISSVHFYRSTSIVFIITGFLSINSLYLETIGTGIGIYSGLFHVTQITQFIETFFYLIVGLVLIGWPQIITKVNKVKYYLTDKYSTDYSLIILFSSLGSSLLITSYDLISLYLSIELQSFGLYVLSTLYRNSESSTKSGLKYFLLGGLSSAIILLGSGIVYSYTGTTNFESIYILNSINDLNTEYFLQGLTLGLLLIFIGFLFKIAAAPLHNWSPDVYDGTPTIVTMYLTILPKIAIFMFLLEISTHFGIYHGPLSIGTLGWNSLSSMQSIAEGVEANLWLKTINFPWGPGPLGVGETYNSFLVESSIYKLLLITSICSLLIGSVLGLSQVKIKRLLAYSTISHIGFILLALLINTEQSIDSFLFYILQYTITNLNLFLIILALTYTHKINSNQLINLSPNNKSLLINKPLPLFSSLLNKSNSKNISISAEIISYKYKDLNYILELKNLFFSNPLLSLCLCICLFSMAGIPPLIGFFSKQFVLYAAIQNGFYLTAILAIIVSVISASYYLKIVKLLISENENETETNTESENEIESEKFSLNLSSPSISANKDNVLSLSGVQVLLPSITDLSFVYPTEPTDPTDPTEGVKEKENKDIIELTNVHSFIISTLTLILLLFFIKPSLILNSTQLLSLSLFYT